MRTLFHRSWGRDRRDRRWWSVTLWFDNTALLVGVAVENHTIEHEVRLHLPAMRLNVWWQDPLPALRSVA